MLAKGGEFCKKTEKGKARLLFLIPLTGAILQDNRSITFAEQFS
jgi:hypothetical protein